VLGDDVKLLVLLMGSWVRSEFGWNLKTTRDNHTDHSNTINIRIINEPALKHKTTRSNLSFFIQKSTSSSKLKVLLKTSEAEVAASRKRV
jgi:hypothetical protein